MENRFLIIVGVIIIAIGGFIVFNKKDAVTANPSEHVVGTNKYSVRLVEYGDFECPACGQYYPLVKQIKDEYKDLIEFQFRNFPLDALHPAARGAHRAAEAAGNQGKFFEMHDLLYENQTSWKGTSSPIETFKSYATQLGLDITRFETDMKSDLTNAIINADVKEGQSTGASGTPTFVLNGKRIEDNPRDIEGFKKLLDEALRAKDPTVKLPSSAEVTTPTPSVENTQTEAPTTSGE